jgi:hypothetical protein
MIKKKLRQNKNKNPIIKLDKNYKNKKLKKNNYIK